MKREELLVAAIQNGTVIDHIPPAKIFEVVNLLHLENVRTSIMVGINLKSHKMGQKSIIKIADKYFTDAELKQYAKRGLIDRKVMALGGVTLEHIPLLKEYGFGGAVLLGDIWNRFDIHTTHAYKELINHFRRLRKAAN